MTCVAKLARMALLLVVWLAVTATLRAEFTMIVLPDTQYYSQRNPELFYAQTNWIAGQRDALNIRFVTQLGDIVENGGDLENRNITEWLRADAAMEVLDGLPDLPYSVALGNHDYDQKNDNAGAADRFVEFFGPQRYQGREWYGGSSPDGRNQYQFFTGDGQRYLHLALEFEPPDAALDWAQSVIAEHPRIPTIISTHVYLERNRTLHTIPESTAGNTGRTLFERLVSPNPQVFMVLNGHRPYEAHNERLNAAGASVFEMLADYQFRPNDGDGWLRIIHFAPEEHRIWVETFSPTRNHGQGDYETDENSRFEFNINFHERFSVIPEPPAGVLATLLFLAVGWCLAIRNSGPRAARSTP